MVKTRKFTKFIKLLNLILIFQGMSIAVLAHPLVKEQPWLRLVGFLFMALGLVGLYYGHRFRPNQEIKNRNILINGMEWFYARSEKVSKYLLMIIGIVIIDAVLIYNLIILQTSEFKGYDAITIALGLVFILYPYIPKKYSTTRDFLTAFLVLLFLILILPPSLYRLTYGPGGDATITKTLLGDPAAALLNLFGFKSHCVIEPFNEDRSAILYFPLLSTGEQASLAIFESCAGIYTASIFISAFITFILSEYKNFNLKIIIIIILGILTTWLANVLRMTIIMLVGIYTDTNPILLENLSWVHSYLAWFIFLAMIIPFWFIIYWSLMRKEIEDN